jgi:LEA14-like dessication related protein
MENSGSRTDLKSWFARLGLTIFAYFTVSVTGFYGLDLAIFFILLLLLQNFAMIKIKWPVIFAVGGSLLYLAYNQVTGLGNLVVTFKKLKFSGFSLMSTNIVVVMEATNPTAIPGYIQHVLGELLLNNRPIGSINGLNTKVTIAPNSTTEIPIPVSLSNVDLPLALAEIRKGQKVAVKYKVISPVGNIEGTKEITLG